MQHKGWTSAPAESMTPVILINIEDEANILKLVNVHLMTTLLTTVTNQDVFAPCNKIVQL